MSRVRAGVTFALGLAIIVAVGLWLRAPHDRAVKFHAKAAAKHLAGDYGLHYSTLTFDGPELCAGAVRSVWKLKTAAPPLSVTCRVSSDAVTLSALGIGSVTRRLPTGWSLLPPLLAILLAFAFRRIIPALAVAILTAALIAADFSPAEALSQGVAIVTPAVSSPFNLSIYAFTIFLIGMVGIQLRSGGLDAMVDRLAGKATTRRSAQLATAAMGGAVFFDDYANSLVVGSSARPLTDRFRISREKLAYLVDSTAAPVAGVAVVSTWIGFEVGLFQDQADLLTSVASTGYGVFFAILPLRFYCILSILFVFLVGVTGRDFGPMLAAERRAARGQLLADGARPMASAELTELRPTPGTPPRVSVGVIPIVVVLLSVLLGYSIGGAWLLGTAEPSSLVWWGQAFSAVGNAMDGNLGAYVLLGASVAGSVAAWSLAVAGLLLSASEAAAAWRSAVRAVLPTLVILALAIAIRGATQAVGADHFLVTLIGPTEPMWLPLTVFLLAAATAFATGTSWGTMGILMPVVVPLVYAQVQGDPTGPLILALSLSAVLDGAIFGDHCSPISDTTVMSSMASACDHIDHVKTQIPYATVVMLAAGILGYTLTAWAQTSPWTAYTLAGLALISFLLIFGRPLDVAQGDHAAGDHAAG